MEISTGVTNMRNLVLAALLAAISVSAAAAPAPSRSPEAMQQDIQALGVWLQRINTAVAPADAALNDLGSQMQTLLPVRSDLAALRANGAKLRILIGQARATVLRSQAALAAIPPLQSATAQAGGLDMGKMLSESRGQMTEMLQYLGDCDAVAEAVEKNDVAAMRVAAPKLLRSSILLLDGRVLTYRGRQAAISPTRSSHQVLGITVDLYRAMSAASRAWIRARVDHQPREAADEQRTQFLTLAEEIEAYARAGRANAAREKSELAAESARAGGNQAVLDVDARATAVLAGEEKLFVIGDQLAAWLRGHAGTTAEQLEAQEQPEVLGALASVEEQLVAASRALAGDLADPGH
jgi:hypothetical protein